MITAAEASAESDKIHADEYVLHDIEVGIQIRSNKGLYETTVPFNLKESVIDTLKSAGYSIRIEKDDRNRPITYISWLQ